MPAVVTSSLWEQRAARNEALFREANENIARLEKRDGTTETKAVYVCECATANCTEQLAIDTVTYGRVRRQSRLFFVPAGHEDPQFERVVERQQDYLIVEKTGEPGEVAQQTQR